jgi:Trk-type K+ transport system membrane component
MGGIGFPLIFDLIEHNRVKKYSRELAPRISLFTKIALLGFAIMTILGIVFSFILEYTYTGPVNSALVSQQYFDIAHYRAQHGEFGNCDSLNRI